MGQITQQRINPKREAVERIRAGRIADRMIGTIAIPKRQAPKRESGPQAITQHKIVRCICCGAPAHEVAHD